MSDNDERRRLDETGEYFPFPDEAENRPIGGPPTDDRTAMSPRAAADPDGTRVLPAVDDDADQVVARAPQGDATSVLPAVGADGTNTERHPRSTDNWAAEGDAVWSARAGVRPRPAGDDFADSDWAAVPADEQRGRWWTPIAVGIVAFLLLGLLGWGLYLIAQSRGRAATPEVTAPPAAPATAGAKTGRATKPPTTAPTTTRPAATTPAAPSDVTVPALKGLSSEEARGALDRKGFNYRLRFVTSDNPAGTVIDSDPAEGRQVPADTVITLIIAADQTTPATPERTETTGPADEQED